MPIFRLTESLVFPSPHYAEPDGLLAVGGDLSPQRLLVAYALGIFPWYSDYTPILWWSPHPRLVLFPDEFRISASLRRVVKKKAFTVTVDRCFREVMQECAQVPRRYGEGTWITEEMLDAYCRLHRLGYAHSVESWQAGELVGGLYGVALGRAFFGESMFMRKTDASKVALVHLVYLLRRFGFEFVDCQVTTAHLQRFGAREIPREDFLGILREAVAKGGLPGSWASTPLEE
ncbi:MAG: leucyl/phenylalanyl-tRNA--protein transferase [Syntrophobacteraceae bacterium]